MLRLTPKPDLKYQIYVNLNNDFTKEKSIVSLHQKTKNTNPLKLFIMGLLGFIYQGGRAIYGMATDNYDIVDEALEKGKRSMFLSLIDPIGVADVPDIVGDVAGDS